MYGRGTVAEMVILLTGSKITTVEWTKRRIMHHLGNFSIRARGASAGAAPRRATGASNDYPPISLSCSAASRSLARGWRPNVITRRAAAARTSLRL
ncbi:unnamed protein product, partial [Iphiclides podalirius]